MVHKTTCEIRSMGILALCTLNCFLYVVFIACSESEIRVLKEVKANAEETNLYTSVRVGPDQREHVIWICTGRVSVILKLSRKY